MRITAAGTVIELHDIPFLNELIIARTKTSQRYNLFYKLILCVSKTFLFMETFYIDIAIKLSGIVC